MGEPRRDSKWWGWGDPDNLPELDAEALATLRERVGELMPRPLAAELEDFSLPAAEPLPQALLDAAGEGAVFASPEDRVRHATGCGYADLARLRLGRLEAAPDAVVVPDGPRRLRAILDACAAEGVAVVPYGGGTSVVGGVEPLRGPHGRLISLDLTGLRGVEVDRRSLTATLGARGEQAHGADQVVEAAVAARGLSGGAGRGEAADRRVLERLGEVAQRQSLLGELAVQRRAQRAGLDPGRA